MDSIVDAMAAAYDALVATAAAAVREPGRATALEDLKPCLAVFNASCDRAEDLVQAAAASLGSAPPADSSLDALCHTVQVIEQDLLAAVAGYQEEKETEEEKGPTTPPVAAAVAAEDK